MAYLYYATISLTSAFNFSAIFIYPLIISILIFSITISSEGLQKIRLSVSDVLLLAFCGVSLLSIAVNTDYFSEKSIGHTAALFSLVFPFYLMPASFSKAANIQNILKINYYQFIFVSIFGLIEFTLANAFNVKFNDYIMRPAVTDYTPAFLDFGLIRSRSVFEESGYYGQYICVELPIIWYYLWAYKASIFKKSVFISLSAAAIFTSYSISVFLFMPISVIFTLFLRFFSVNRGSGTFKALLASLVVVIIIISAVAASGDLQNALFARKLGGNSYTDRVEKFDITVAVMKNAGVASALFGFGPGSYFPLRIPASISVYVNFWRDYGILGVSLFSAAIISFIMKLSVNKNGYATPLLISTIFVSMSFVSMPSYYYPYCALPFLLNKLFERGDSNSSSIRPSKRSGI